MLPPRPVLSQHSLDAIAQAELADPERHQHPQTPTEPPEYGTDAWRQLADDDPAKLAAVFAAADRWSALLDSPYAAEVLAALCEWDDRRIYIEWGDTLSQFAREWGEPGPSYEELERRRAELPADYLDRVAQHGEYLGGVVLWEPARQAAA
jgi:hypothetical protein